MSSQYGRARSRTSRTTSTTDLDVVRVFTGDDGGYGNPLGVFREGGAIPVERRQAVANELAFSETVFVDDVALGVVRLFTPRNELPFAGHPLVGTSWLLHREGVPVRRLRPPAGMVETWLDDDGIAWIRARPQWVAPCSHLQLASVDEVERASGAPLGHDFVQIWAWDDERRGVVRARTFAPREGVHEDEACGMASLLLAAALGRRLRIKHGRGSEILARAGPAGTIEIGGRVSFSERRRYALSTE